MKVTVLPRQNIADIAIQVYGDVRAAVDIAIANNISVTSDLEAGTELECPDIVYDPYLQDYARKNNIKPAAGLSELDDVQARIFTDQFTEEFI